MKNSEDPLDRFLERWADEYNAPPKTPRDEMWSAIEASISGASGAEEPAVVSLDEARRGRRARRFSQVGWLGWASAAAAMLVVGIGIGRWSTSPGPEAGSVADASGGAGATFRVAALEHFSQSESFLTLVRADARAGRIDPEVADWAGGLLSQTRLLMDSPAGEDPATRKLLEDLELILVQVVGVDGSRGGGEERVRREMDLLASGIDEQAVLSRLQTVMLEAPGGRAGL